MYLVLFVPNSILAGDADTVQACAAGVSRRAKKLLDMHLSCQRLDKMLKTEHFSEDKMGGFQLIQKLRDIHQNGAQRAIQVLPTRVTLSKQGLLQTHSFNMSCFMAFGRVFP